MSKKKNNKKPDYILDYNPKSYAPIKGAWGEFIVTAIIDGKEVDGICQGDGEMWALETFKKK